MRRRARRAPARTRRRRSRSRRRSSRCGRSAMASGRTRAIRTPSSTTKIARNTRSSQCRRSPASSTMVSYVSSPSTTALQTMTATMAIWNHCASARRAQSAGSAERGGVEAIAAGCSLRARGSLRGRRSATIRAWPVSSSPCWSSSSSSRSSRGRCVELRPGAERKAREAEERRERREADAAERFPVGTIVRCEACGAQTAEVREEPFVSERRREVRALVACASCGAVARRRLARLPSGR